MEAFQILYDQLFVYPLVFGPIDRSTQHWARKIVSQQMNGSLVLCRVKVALCEEVRIVRVVCHQMKRVSVGEMSMEGEKLPNEETRNLKDEPGSNVTSLLAKKMTES